MSVIQMLMCLGSLTNPEPHSEFHCFFQELNMDDCRFHCDFRLTMHSLKTCYVWSVVGLSDGHQLQAFCLSCGAPVHPSPVRNWTIASKSLNSLSITATLRLNLSLKLKILICTNNANKLCIRLGKVSGFTGSVRCTGLNRFCVMQISNTDVYQ